MKYRLVLAAGVSKRLSALDSRTLRRIEIALDFLVENPRPPKSKKLVGRVGYRIRVGDYRILYEVKDQEIVVLVFRIAHRREAYKD